MGRGKDWNSDEYVVLAKAWVQASCDPIVGVGQKAAVFWAKVKLNFDALSPVDHETGRYSHRGGSTLKHCWTDSLQPAVNKFQAKLTRTIAAKLTGNLTEDQLINVAVAFHLGEIDKPSYDARSFDASSWKFFDCWYSVLRKQPKFSRSIPGANSELAARVASLSATGAALDAALDGSGDAGAPPAAAGVPASVTIGATSSGSNEEVSVASVADTADPCSVSASKRGGYLGRGKAKVAEKQQKKEEEKVQDRQQKNIYMKELVEIAKTQATTGNELKTILSKGYDLEKKKQKMQDAKLAMKMAKHDGDSEMYERAKKKMKKYCLLSDSEDDQEDGGNSLE